MDKMDKMDGVGVTIGEGEVVLLNAVSGKYRGQGWRRRCLTENLDTLGPIHRWMSLAVNGRLHFLHMREERQYF